MKHSAIAILCLALSSCTSNTGVDNASNKHPEAIVGKWQNEMIRVTMYSVRDTDESEIFEANKLNWEEKLGIKPIVTTFNKDGSYHYAYVNLDDSVIGRVEGKWHMKGDSLYFVQVKPQKDKAVYHVVINDDFAKFTSMLDWDSDGKKDDIYFGVQKKIDSNERK